MGNQLTVRGIVFSALFAALLVALSFLQVKLPFTPVPITMENLAVMLAGAILGARYGFLSILLVVVLTALGLPLLHNTGGLSDIVGPNGGYVWMWPICAFLTGFAVQKVKRNNITAFILIFLSAFVLGDLLSYVTGVLWLAHVLHLTISQALIGGCYPFLIGDAFKAFVVALVTIPVRMVYPVSRLVGSAQSAVVDLRDIPSAQ